MGGKSEVCAVLVQDSHVIVIRNVSEPPSRIFLPPLLEAIREIFRLESFATYGNLARKRFRVSYPVA